MDTKTLIKKLSLTDEDLSRINRSVREAEKNTSGEIVLCVTAESSDYSFWELFASVIAALAVTIAMLPFSGRILELYERLNWAAPQWRLPAIYILTAFFLILILFFIFNIPALDNKIIPKFYKQKEVNARAMRAFTECGVYSTREHTGILIFVSYLERQVRIVADAGVAKKISGDLWALIADSLAGEIGKKNAAGGFCDAAQKCGELLAQYFPADKNDNPDELDDSLIILER